MHQTIPDRFAIARRKSGCWLITLAGFTALGFTAAAKAQDPPGGKDRPANRLASETSPYLRLHAHNPVDWHPWGPEAFAKAKAQNKPIFLSVGYSSCYWCHVMERESFNDPEIAAYLNEHFVSIKVDREERPDVDQVYMAALQAFSSGGWPMTMFLLPDGRPFYGDTYLPPRDRQGAAGFLTVIKGIDKAFREERTEIDRAADGLTEIVQRKLGTTASRRKPPLSRAMATQGQSQLAAQFDPEYGGFGFNPQNARRPKFPEPVNLVFLLDQYARDARRSPRKGSSSAGLSASPRDPLFMVLFTLDRMARGGIRDQLGGGYHRYATSRYWIVPHFEKMLCDNAQLASVHLKAFEITGDARWRAEAEATFAFIARTMTAPDGGFYSALDAETAGGEGAYYVWSRDEVTRSLGEGPDTEAFLQVYGLKRSSNFEGDRFVLLQPRPIEEQARSLNNDPAKLQHRLGALAARLLDVRERRPGPARDDKILTAWNGLMIAAYADGYRVLRNETYRAAAERSAGFVLSRLRNSSGRLLRSHCAGQSRLSAYLEDYAFLIHGLLRLHTATADRRWLDEARSLADRMIADFEDPANGGFFFTAGDHESLLARPKNPNDGAIPGGNSMAAMDLLALHRATGEARYAGAARKTLESFGTALAQNPAAMPMMLVALQDELDARPESGPPSQLAAGSEARPHRPDIVTASAHLADGERPAPGTPVKAMIVLKITPGWHLYANPSGVAALKPTTLSLEASSPARLDVAYPRGVLRVLDSTGNEQVALYEGAVEIPVQVTPDAMTRPGKSTLMLRLVYQACDETACVAPASLAIPLEIDIAPTTAAERTP